MRNKKCTNCVEPCPMAGMAHEAAKGRMYATNEFISLLKKVECGQLVEVVRCKDCAHSKELLDYDGRNLYCLIWGRGFPKVLPEDFCSYGEKSMNEEVNQ